MVILDEKGDDPKCFEMEGARGATRHLWPDNPSGINDASAINDDDNLMSRADPEFSQSGPTF
jgi:hypothetical protein